MSLSSWVKVPLSHELSESEKAENAKKTSVAEEPKEVEEKAQRLVGA